MKIALIGTAASSAFIFRADLIRSLSAAGDEVYVFCLDFDGKSRQNIVDIGGIPVDYSFSRTGMNPFNDIFDTLKLSRSIKKINPDIVFSYFSKPVIFGTFAAKIAGKYKCVGMLEGLGYVFTDLPGGLHFKQKILRKVQIFLYKYSFRLLERIIFLNPDDPVDLMEKNNIKAKNVSVLGGIGVNLEDFEYSEVNVSGEIKFIFIGRLLAEKGINEYFLAAKIVKSKFPNARFLVAGGIDEENPGGISRKELNELIEAGLIEYIGYVNDIKKYIQSSDVFVLPSSYREGVPRSTQEAMAIGRAVITTDVPGCRETVEDGVNGYLIPRWNHEILAEKMEEFIKNKDLVRAMGRESRRIAEKKFDVDEVNVRLIGLLKSDRTTSL